MILEIKKSRSIIDSPESQHKIFPFSVDYSRVQLKIAMKYDYWQKEVLFKFGNFLGLFFNVRKTNLKNCAKLIN